MYIYIFIKMVTWLQIVNFPVIGMSLGVTNLVTNGYNGYKDIKSVQAYLFRIKRIN